MDTQSITQNSGIEYIEKMARVGLLEKRIVDGEVEYKKTEWLNRVLKDKSVEKALEDIEIILTYSKDEEEDINHPDYKDKTNYHEYTREECEYHNIDYDELHADDEDFQCRDCDYTLSQGEFDSGKGRIMFNDVNEEGTEYRCGCCDDRVADPMGMFPDDEFD